MKEKVGIPLWQKNQRDGQQIFPAHSINAYKIVGVLFNIKPIKRDIAPDFLDTTVLLQYIGMGILSRVIRTAHLGTLGKDTLLTPALEVFLTLVTALPKMDYSTTLHRFSFRQSAFTSFTPRIPVIHENILAFSLP